MTAHSTLVFLVAMNLWLTKVCNNVIFLHSDWHTGSYSAILANPNSRLKGGIWSQNYLSTTWSHHTTLCSFWQEFQLYMQSVGSTNKNAVEDHISRSWGGSIKQWPWHFLTVEKSMDISRALDVASATEKSLQAQKAVWFFQAFLFAKSYMSLDLSNVLVLQCQHVMQSL